MKLRKFSKILKKFWEKITKMLIICANSVVFAFGVFAEWFLEKISQNPQEILEKITEMQILCANSDFFGFFLDLRWVTFWENIPKSSRNLGEKSPDCKSYAPTQNV